MAVKVNDGDLSWQATIDDTALDAIAAKIEGRVSKMSDNVKREGDEMAQMFNRAAKAAAGFLSIQAGTELISNIVKVRGEFQQLEVAFSTILGSKDRADKLMAQAVDLAAKTPFSLNDVASGSKQLLAYGFAAESLTDNLTMLGNIASGVSAPLNDIVYLYGTLQTQGRAYTKDIMQFTGRGIPIIQALANQFGVTSKEVNSLVEAGKVGFPEVEKAFRSLTGEGGMFFNLMEAQSQTISGQISNLGDAFDSMLNEIGRKNQDFIRDSISGIATLVENYETIVKILGVLITTYGAYRAAVILTSAIQLTAAQASAGVTLAFKLQYAWTNLLTTAQRILNTTMLANPYVAVATALTLLAGAMIAFYDNTSRSEKAVKSLNEKAEITAQRFEDLAAKTSKLNSVLRDETATRYSQLEAFAELQKLYPELLKNKRLEEFQNLSLTEAQRALNVEIEKQKLNAKVSEYNNVIAKIKEYEARIKDLKNAISTSGDSGGVFAKQLDVARENLEVAKIEAQKLGKEVKDNEQKAWEANTPIEAQRSHWEGVIKSLTNQIDTLRKSTTATDILGRTAMTTASVFDNMKVTGLNDSLQEAIKKLNALKSIAIAKRTVGTIESEIDELRNSAKNATTRKEHLEYEQKINALIKERDAITGPSQKSLNKGLSDAKKLSEDRLQFLKDLANKEFEISVSAKEKTEAEILRIQKEYQEKRAEAAKLKLGPGVIQRIDTAENKEIGVVNQAKELNSLKESIEAQKQVFQQFEAFKTQVSLAEANKRFTQELKGFDNYGQLLQSELNKLNAIPLSGLNAAQRDLLDFLHRQLIEFNNDQRESESQRYAEAFQSAMSYNQRLEQINKEYNDKAKALNRRLTDEEKQNLLSQKEAAIQAARDEAFQKTEIYKSVSQDLILLSRNQIEEQINALQVLLDNGTISGEIKSKVEADLSGLKLMLDIGVDQSNIDIVKSRIKDIETALNQVSLGESIISDSEYKKLVSELVNLKNLLEKIANPDGTPTSNFIKGLKENFKYLKDGAGTSEFFQGLSNDFGRLGSSFNELSNALGGVETKAGYTADTIGRLVTVASDAAGAAASFAAGDIIGGVTKTIKAISGVLAIGKKVKEMNAAARKEVEDFYAKAISGEQEYLDKLRERELQRVRDNKSALQGIRDEIALRKDQLASYSKEASEIMAKLQGLSYVTDVKYTHGTWFRKAKTENILSSLQGKSFEELSKLLSEGKLDGQAKALVERLIELEQKGYDAEQALADLAKQTNEIFTGTTSDALTDGLLSFIKEGKTGFKDLSEFFEEQMTNASISIFRNKILANLMDKFYDEFANLASSGDELTAEEIEQLRAAFFALSETATEEFEKLKDITGLKIKTKVEVEAELNAEKFKQGLDELNQNVLNLFKKVELTAEDFGNNFTEIIRQSIFKGFEEEYFANGLKDFYSKLREFESSGGILSKEEIAILKAEYDSFIENAKLKLIELEEISGVELIDFGKTKFEFEAEVKSMEDAILQMLQNSTDPVEDFGNYFKTIMKSAILESFQATVLRDQLTDFYQQFREISTSADGLTEEKIALLRSEYDAIIRKSQEEFQKISQVTGIDFSPQQNRTSLSSTISRSITEDTASALAGLWTGYFEESLRQGQTLIKSLAVATQCLERLTQIQYNTAATANNTSSTNNKLDELIRAMRQTSGRTLADSYTRI